MYFSTFSSHMHIFIILICSLTIDPNKDEIKKEKKEKQPKLDEWIDNNEKEKQQLSIKNKIISLIYSAYQYNSEKFHDIKQLFNCIKQRIESESINENHETQTSHPIQYLPLFMPELNYTFTKIQYVKDLLGILSLT